MPAPEPGSDDAVPEGAPPARNGPAEYRWPEEGEGGRVDAPAYELFVRGTSFLAGGHPGPAATLLRKAASLAPTKNSIREALARSYYALGEFEAAAAEFELIAEAVPSNDYAQFGLGCSLLALERPVAARGRLRLAAAMNPDRREYGERLERAERAVAESRLDEADPDDA